MAGSRPPPPPTEDEQVRRHVRDHLLALEDLNGERLTAKQAGHLADAGVDWHEFAALREGGATLDQARGIVRPL